MSRLAASVADRVIAHSAADELTYYGLDWALVDIHDLLREARRLADDYRCRVGVDRTASEWSSIEIRLESATSSSELSRYGSEHASADIRALLAAVDELEADLLRLLPRMSG